MHVLRSYRSLLATRVLHEVCWLIIALSMLSSLPLAVSQPPDLRPKLEYQVKASLLFNFLQFIEWPPDSGKDSHDPFRVCLIGVDRFGVALDGFERELIRGKRIQIARFPELAVDGLYECQVVFVSKGSEINLDKLLLALKNQSVLTVGETPDFLERGGIMSILVEDGKVVFDINRSATLEARLSISSKLLRIARRVKE